MSPIAEPAQPLEKPRAQLLAGFVAGCLGLWPGVILWKSFIAPG